MREEFEKWYKNNHPNCNTDRLQYSDVFGSYESRFVDGMYHAFCKMKEHMAKQEPVGVFHTNGDIGYADLIPHQGAALYDGQPLYASPVQPSFPGYILASIDPEPETIDRAVSFALNVSLSADYTWSQYMADLYKHMIAR